MRDGVAVDEINTRLAELFAEPLLRPANSVRAPQGRRLGKPLSQTRIVVFEQVNDIELPEAYRQFLAEVGDGGVGPELGLDELSTWQTVELPARMPTVLLPGGAHQALRVVSHGGEDETVLLVSGPGKGRLVDRTTGAPPKIHEEPGFIEWYLAWLRTAEGSQETPRHEPVLVDMLRNGPEARQRAVYELGALPQLADETRALIERAALHDECSGVRYRAVDLLGELEPRNPDVFLKALEDPKRSVRRRALVHLLRRHGDTATWSEALDTARTSDSATVQIAEGLEQERQAGLTIPKE